LALLKKSEATANKSYDLLEGIRAR